MTLLVLTRLTTTERRAFGCCQDCAHHRGTHRPDCHDCGCLEFIPHPYATLEG